MWSYFKIELIQFFTNKKNIAIYIILLSITLFYSLRIVPDYDPIEKVDYDEIEARYLTRSEFLEQLENRPGRTPHPSIEYAAWIFNDINPHDQARLQALDEGDLKTYALETAQWYEKTNAVTSSGDLFFYNPRYYSYGNEFSHEEGYYGYSEASVRYAEFGQADYKLTIELFEGRTAFQTLERLLKGPLPIILFICTLFLCVDIVTKDRRHRTLLKGFPLSDWKKLVIKTFVSYIGSLTLIVPIFIGFIIVGLQEGFGNLQIPVPYYNYIGYGQLEPLFQSMSMVEFLLQCGVLIVAWIIVIIAIVMLLSVVLHQEMINLCVGLFLLFTENFYFRRGAGHDWAVEDVPTSYIQVGQVVTHLRNFYYRTANIKTELGLQLLFACAAIIIAFTLVIVINKRFKLLK